MIRWCLLAQQKWIRGNFKLFGELWVSFKPIVTVKRILKAISPLHSQERIIKIAKNYLYSSSFSLDRWLFFPKLQLESIFTDWVYSCLKPKETWLWRVCGLPAAAKFFANISSLTPPNNPGDVVRYSLCLFHGRGDLGSEKLCNFPKVTQLITDKAGIWTQIDMA